MNRDVERRLQLQFESFQSVSQERNELEDAPFEILWESPSSWRARTQMPVSEIAPMRKILTQPRVFWIKMPVLRKKPWMMVMTVNSPTARSFCSRSVGSRRSAKNVYLEKTMQLLAVNPRKTAWTAINVDARNLGRGYVYSRYTCSLSFSQIPAVVCPSLILPYLPQTEAAYTQTPSKQPTHKLPGQSQLSRRAE